MLGWHRLYRKQVSSRRGSRVSSPNLPDPMEVSSALPAALPENTKRGGGMREMGAICQIGVFHLETVHILGPKWVYFRPFRTTFSMIVAQIVVFYSDFSLSPGLTL